MLKHKEYYIENLQADSEDEIHVDDDGRVEVDEGKGNIYSSELVDFKSGNHAPVLDIDHRCELVPSSTDGHFHLYIDVPMKWEVYENLLNALVDAHIISSGYRDASVKRGATFVRKPGVYKDENVHTIDFK